MAEMYQSANREQQNGEQRIFGAGLSDTLLVLWHVFVGSFAMLPVHSNGARSLLARNRPVKRRTCAVDVQVR